MDSNENKISQLKPRVARMAREFVKKMKERYGVDLLVTCAYRSPEDQDKLYAQGRTVLGVPIVTNARAGQSFHNWKCAIDVVPLLMGKPNWNSTYSLTSKVGKECGFFWGGDFTGKFKDFPHFEATMGYTFKDFQNGKIDESKFT